MNGMLKPMNGQEEDEDTGNCALNSPVDNESAAKGETGSRTEEGG